MNDAAARPRATIVVRCYNESAHLPTLFERLGSQMSDFELVFVDSGSTDGSLAIAARFGARIVEIPKEKFSFGRALNVGCEVGLGEFLVFISAHCFPEHDDWLDKLLEAFKDPQVALVYGKQRGTAESHWSEQQIFRTWFPDESVQRQDHPFCNNANAAIRRSLWEQFKYDEDLTGLEDVAWAQSVMRHGWFISYQADAGVVHVHHESPRLIRNRYRREAITFQKVFPNEHFNIWDFCRLLVRNAYADWRRATEVGRLGEVWWDVLTFRFNQFLGTYQGFHTRRPPSSALKRRFYYPDNQ